HGRWLASQWVARASGRLEELLWHSDRRQILASLAYQDGIRLMQPINGRRLAGVNFRPFVAESFTAVSFGQGGSLPNAGGARFELANDARPVVDIGRRTRVTVGRHCGLSELSHGSAYRFDGTE